MATDHGQTLTELSEQAEWLSAGRFEPLTHSTTHPLTRSRQHHPRGTYPPPAPPLTSHYAPLRHASHASHASHGHITGHTPSGQGATSILHATEDSGRPHCQGRRFLQAKRPFPWAQRNRLSSLGVNDLRLKMATRFQFTLSLAFPRIFPPFDFPEKMTLEQ